jgi:sodium transport system permease protein
MNAPRPGWRMRIWSVFAKELLDHSRDLRSVISSLILPLLGPVIIGLTLYATTGGGQIAEANTERNIAVGVAGARHAPDLIAHLEDSNVTFKPAPEDEEQRQRLVRQGSVGAILHIPPEAQGRDVYGVEILVDRTRPFSTLVAGILANRVAEFSRQRATALVRAAGLDETAIQPVRVAETNVGRRTNVTSLFYRMIPPLVLFTVFMGAVHLAIDITVGERERGSVEPLLTAPLSRWELLSGKAITVLFFAAGLLALHLGAFKLILDMVTSHMQGAQPPPAITNMILIYALVVPLMALAVLLQMSIGAITRSTKEAQIYLGLLPIVPMIPGLAMTLNALENSLALVAIPILGQVAIMQNLVQNEPVSLAHIAISVVATCFAAGLAFIIAVRVFRREKLLF